MQVDKALTFATALNDLIKFTLKHRNKFSEDSVALCTTWQPKATEYVNAASGGIVQNIAVRTALKEVMDQIRKEIGDRDPCELTADDFHSVLVTCLSDANKDANVWSTDMCSLAGTDVDILHTLQFMATQCKK